VAATIDVTSLALEDANYRVMMSMVVPAGQGLIHPVVTARTATTFTVEWGTLIPAEGYVILWELTGDGTEDWTAYGTADIADRATSVTITGLGRAEVPTVVLATVSKPGSLSTDVYAVFDEDSATTDSITFKLAGGAITRAGYRLMYLILA
jgi:hypothetical protein